jgi:hypothetical protein
MSRCSNHWRGHHRFEPRYESEPADKLEIGGFQISGEANRQLAREMFTKRTYVRDICVRCGETVER